MATAAASTMVKKPSHFAQPKIRIERSAAGEGAVSPMACRMKTSSPMSASAVTSMASHIVMDVRSSAMPMPKTKKKIEYARMKPKSAYWACRAAPGAAATTAWNSSTSCGISSAIIGRRNFCG